MKTPVPVTVQIIQKSLKSNCIFAEQVTILIARSTHQQGKQLNAAYKPMKSTQIYSQKNIYFASAGCICAPTKQTSKFNYFLISCSRNNCHANESPAKKYSICIHKFKLKNVKMRFLHKYIFFFLINSRGSGSEFSINLIYSTKPFFYGVDSFN